MDVRYDDMYYVGAPHAGEHQVVRFAPAGASVGPKNYADVKWGADKEVRLQRTPTKSQRLKLGT